MVKPGNIFSVMLCYGELKKHIEPAAEQLFVSPCRESQITPDM